MSEAADLVIRAKPRRGQRAEQIKLLHDRFPQMPHSVIAQKVGCAPPNVTQVINRYVKAITPQELADFQQNKADIFDSLQHSALASITHAKLSKANLLQTVTAAAILEDKARLVRGQATSINVNALLDVAELIRQQKG